MLKIHQIHEFFLCITNMIGTVSFTAGFRYYSTVKKLNRLVKQTLIAKYMDHKGGEGECFSYVQEKMTNSFFNPEGKQHFTTLSQNRNLSSIEAQVLFRDVKVVYF